MGIVGTLYEFTAQTTIVSDYIDQNFADLKASINTAVFSDTTATITVSQRFANNVALVGRNVTNTADVTMWKIGTTNLLETNSEIRCVTVAPATDSAYDLGTTDLRWDQVWADKLILTTQTPASAAASGTAGEVAWDTSYLYVCVGTNTWKRVAIATW